MKKIKILRVLFSLIFIPGIALALGCGYYGFGGNKTLLEGVTTSDLGIGIQKLISNIVDFIINCIVLYALIGVIIFGGVYIFISMGDPKQIERGKNIILAGIIGLIIIFAAEEIVKLISK